ncbi:hypothetical protein Apa02nite_065560 [Actinoplanes palleronii]|uniref:Uncharacterized protein n=1 Tax=Actinoplanes palleronii TaxID=113570 RepID=A0ABQ4BID8_9ACTN|nr:hypothetical protein Apa02nite_065560 [Actinoplanes palleronii]
MGSVAGVDDGWLSVVPDVRCSPTSGTVDGGIGLTRPGPAMFFALAGFTPPVDAAPRITFVAG